MHRSDVEPSCGNDETVEAGPAILCRFAPNAPTSNTENFYTIAVVGLYSSGEGSLVHANSGPFFSCPCEPACWG